MSWPSAPDRDRHGGLLVTGRGARRPADRVGAAGPGDGLATLHPRHRSWHCPRPGPHQRRPPDRRSRLPDRVHRLLMDAAYRGPPPRCAGNLLDGMHTSHLAGSQSVQERGCRLSAWRRGSRGLPERVRSQCVHAPGTSGGACWLQQVWLWRGQCPRASPIAHEDDRSAEASWSLSPRRRPPSTTTLSWQPLPGTSLPAAAVRVLRSRDPEGTYT